ncbi:MAG: hypothetical protein KC646_07800 [Candidatus Cloacimonetes bacterium]|nr:hypothetical protein [Candidatus Cloacimonadota bacterium]
MSLYSLDHRVHIVCFLSFFTYLSYYQSMKRFTSMKVGPRVGLNLCYGYSSFFLSAVGVFHFSFLSSSYYYLLFMQSFGLYSLMISTFLLFINVSLIIILRNLFANVYFFKSGLYIKYLDGRFTLLYFEDMKEMLCKYWWMGSLYYFVKKSGHKTFMFHGSLKCNRELKSFIEDKLKQFPKD